MSCQAVVAHVSAYVGMGFLEVEANLDDQLCGNGRRRKKLNHLRKKKKNSQLACEEAMINSCVHLPLQYTEVNTN